MSGFQEEGPSCSTLETGRTPSCLMSLLLYKLLSLGETGLGDGCLWNKGIWICHLQELGGCGALRYKTHFTIVVVGFNGKSPFLLG